MRKNFVLAALALAGLCPSLACQGVLAGEHVVSFLADQDEVSLRVAQAAADTLAARGYTAYAIRQALTGEAQDQEEDNPEAELKVRILPADLETKGAVFATSSQENLRAAADEILTAYLTASGGSEQSGEIAEASEEENLKSYLEDQPEEVLVNVSSYKKEGEALDLEQAKDQAWAGYLIANGIDRYFLAQEEAPLPESEAEQGTLSPSANAGEGALSEPTEDEIATAQAKLQQVLYQAYTSLPAGNGSWAIYTCDLKHVVSGYAPATAADRMQAASLIKLYIMGAVYENYESLSSAYGASTLDGYLYPMITVSDNDAANALVSILGGGDAAAGMNVVNNYCQTHNYSATHMGRLLLASNEYDDNYTSVRDCGRFLTDLYRSAAGDMTLQEGQSLWSNPQLGAEVPHAQDMLNLLSAQQRRHKIPANMPAGVRVANKTGELSDVENDAAIIYDTANGNDLVLVFMSENLSSPGSAQSAIAQVARQIYDAYQ